MSALVYSRGQICFQRQYLFRHVAEGFQCVRPPLKLVLVPSPQTFFGGLRTGAFFIFLKIIFHSNLLWCNVILCLFVCVNIYG